MGTDTRNRILAAAARLFHERGFEATGVATILREVGVNSGSLYHFFPSKEALLVGVLERHLESLHSTILEPAAGATDDPIERVFALLGLYRRGLVITDFTRGCLIGNLALEVGDGRPHVRALIEASFSVWAEGVRSWLDAAGDRLPADLDRGALSRFVLTVMEGAVMQARAAGSLEPFDASVAQLRSYMELLAAQARLGRGEAPAMPAGRETVEPSDEAPPPGRSAWRSW